jgi:hypothetical protein
MPPNENEPNVWSITNKILVAAGSAISLLIIAVATLVLMGFNTQDSRRIADNAALLSQICEIKDATKTINGVLLTLTKDISRIDANQLERMNRERDDRYRGKKP